MSRIAVQGAQPVSAEIRYNLVEPFVTATRAALGEMAGTDVAVRSVRQNPCDHVPGDVLAVLRLTLGTEARLVLSFPTQTASAIARCMLAGVSTDFDEQLIGECVGEIGNVVAGQAKALLAGTPYRFTFSLPEVGANDFQCAPGLDCLVIDFNSEQGEFYLRLFLKL